MMVRIMLSMINGLFPYLSASIPKGNIATNAPIKYAEKRILDIVGSWVSFGRIGITESDNPIITKTEVYAVSIRESIIFS